MPKAENIIIGIYGNKGDGKTTTLTLFLYLEKISHVKNHLFSNYSLTFGFKWLDGKDMIELTNKLDDSTIGIDELHEYADSRESMSIQNKRVSDFFLQSRHTNSNIYYTTQYKDQIDKRIARITDIDVICKNMYIDSDKDGDDDIFQVIVIDRRINMDRNFFFYARPVFNMFNTRERINPFIFTDKEAEIWRKSIKRKKQ